MNCKGDFFIYLIFSVVIILIGAIIFYVYQGQDSFNLFNKNQDLNFSSLEKTSNKLPPTNSTALKDNYKNTYDFKAEIQINDIFELKDNNIYIYGKPKIIIAEREFLLKDPYLINFEGTLSNTIEGHVESILFEDSEIKIKSKISLDYNDIDKLIIEDLKINFENTNITGIVYLDTSNLNLDKAYLNFKGFIGTATINPKKNTIMFEGKIGYLKVKNNSVTTTLE